MHSRENSNEFDAVVIGGGPHGLTYAHWLREQRPGTRIAVVERNESPGFKIGESTLSSATKSMVATGLPMPVLRRLFGNKAGIRFWWTDKESATLQKHIDVVDIEETFQVERRVLEIAMQESVGRHPEITLMTGTKIDLKNSMIEGRSKEISCIDRTGQQQLLKTPLLCDASGPAALMARHRKKLVKDPAAEKTFTTNAYYAYFRGKGPKDLPHWNEPATRHLCFPGGWTWFISLTSWEKTPEDNLRSMIRFLIDHPEGPDESYPTREELCERFDCTTEQVTSVGFVVRSDLDETTDLNAEQSFRHYAESHPAIASLLDHYELIEEPYQGRRAYGSFRNMLHLNTEPAGDGWVSVGDAALFVNPLFSPGMNLGSGTCYLAAQLSAEGLDRNDLSRSHFKKYGGYISSLYKALVAETDLYYRSFEDPRLYELALTLKIFYGTADVIQGAGDYSEEDLNVHGLLNTEFRDIVDGVRILLQEGESEGLSLDERYRRVYDVIRPFIDRLLDRPEVRRLRIGSLFSNYDARGRRVSKGRRRRKAFGVRNCRSCHSWSDRSLPQCPVCGTTPPMRSLPSGTRHHA